MTINEEIAILFADPMAGATKSVVLDIGSTLDDLLDAVGFTSDRVNYVFTCSRGSLGLDSELCNGDRVSVTMKNQKNA